MSIAAQTRLRFGEPWDGAPVIAPGAPKRVYSSSHGVLFEGDCLHLLPHVRDESVDTVFADPPFNLGKAYGERFDDRLPDTEYVAWCRHWLDECIRVLKPGGALFVYNLPKWNILLGAYFMERHLMFRHDIAVSIKLSLPTIEKAVPTEPLYERDEVSEGTYRLYFHVAMARPSSRRSAAQGTLGLGSSSVRRAKTPT
jgi:hypothetical protein